MNGILLVDKPGGWTSMDVCAKLRGVLHQRKIGHSGTLDPMATGLLVVFLGRATRGVEFAESHEKEYRAVMRLGLRTDTQDLTGRILSETAPQVSDRALQETLTAFTGEISQLPPMYSAVKVGGRKLYEIARRGGEAERKPRTVQIHELELLGREGEGVSLRVRCSKGTYIRTLCSDMGDRLGCGAALAALQRTACGRFTLDQAHSLEAIIAAAEQGSAEALLLPLDRLFDEFEKRVIDADQEKKCRCGAAFPLDAPEGVYRLYSENGGFLALSRVSGGRAETIKSFFEV